jgi:hypothetical protein
MRSALVKSKSRPLIACQSRAAVIEVNALPNHGVSPVDLGAIALVLDVLRRARLLQASRGAGIGAGRHVRPPAHRVIRSRSPPLTICTACSSSPRGW